MERRSSITITVSDPKQSDEEVLSQSDVRELKAAADVDPAAATVRQPPPLQSVRVARAHKHEAGGLHDPDVDEVTPSIKKTLLGASVPPALRIQAVHPPRNLHPATPPPDWEPHLSSDEVALLQDQVARLALERAKRNQRLMGIAALVLVLVGGVGYALGTQTVPSEPPSDTARLQAELKSKNEQLAHTLAERDALRASALDASAPKASAAPAPVPPVATEPSARGTHPVNSAKAAAPGMKLAQNAVPRARTLGPTSLAAHASASSVPPADSQTEAEHSDSAPNSTDDSETLSARENPSTASSLAPVSESGSEDSRSKLAETKPTASAEEPERPAQNEPASAKEVTGETAP